MPQEDKKIIEKFSTRLRKAFGTAIKIVQNRKETVVRTDHLVQTLYFQEGGIAAEVLRKANIKPSIFLGDAKNQSPVPPKAPETAGKEINNLGRLFRFMRTSKKEKVGGLRFSQALEKAILKSVLIAQKHSHNFVGTEHLLLAILETPNAKIIEIFRRQNIETEFIREQLRHVLASTAKFTDMTMMFNLKKRPKKKTNETLAFFCEDLTNPERVKNADPVLAREKEIERVIHVLSRRYKNNALIVGEPGVGKTALVEGLAERIVKKQVPPILRRKKILRLDLAKIIAGTMFRGEFEGRLKNLIEEAEQNKDIVIFIDELHSIIGLGNAQGSLDATNILKPALASGKFQCLGTTTFDEYRKQIEHDPAFERRFQMIKIEEPSYDETLTIINGLKKSYEDYHNVLILPEAIEAAIKLSTRYLPEKKLPDKALDLLDEAAAKINIHLADNAVFQQIEELRIELAAVTAKKNQAALEELFADAAAYQNQEKILRKKIEKLRQKEKKARQDWPVLGAEEVAKIVAHSTGVPLSKIIKEEKNRLLNLENILKKRIVGQEEALATVAKFIRRSRSGLSHPKRPVGSFMFLGPTGIGKTELAKVIAEEVFGDEKALIRIDMSEFQEKFNTSRLIGAPAGYVGFEEGGKLTEAVRKKPYAVVLFDEIEKAHPDTFNLLLQILDDGHLTDAAGKKINFKNTLIVMTSNTGSKSILTAEVGFQNTGKQKELLKGYEEKIKKDLKETFRPEFLNRVDRVIIFNPLNQNSIQKIVELELSELKKRLYADKKLILEVSPEVKKEIGTKGFDPERGARPLRKAIQELIEDPLAEKLIGEEIKEGDKIEIKKTETGIEVIKVN